MRHRSIILMLAVAGLAALGQIVGSTDPVERSSSAEGGAPVVAEAAPPAVCDLYEGDVVLELVREHRRGEADEARRELARTIVTESRAAGLDPLLVASIVASESSFRPRAVSHAGAVGLMQLRPFVAADVATRVDVDWQGRETLETPSLNLRLGIVYYRELLVRFDGDEEIALSAYNQGPTRVRGKLTRGTYRASDYAGKILARYGELAGARPADPLRACMDAA